LNNPEHNQHLYRSLSEDGAILYRLLFEKMLAEVHLWELVRDSEGKINTWRLLDANPAALETWGCTLKEVIGKTTDEIFSGVDASKQFKPIVERIFKEQKPHVWEQFFPGTRQILHMISIPFGERFISCGVDVSGIRKTETELLKMSKELNETLMSTIASIARALASKDAYTGEHQKKVAILSEKIAIELGLNSARTEGVRLGASIHDIGNISIPAEIINKPGPLGETELELVKVHAKIGAGIVSDIKFPWPIKEIISQHHERLDGSGYPEGLKGDQIILEARIVAVADVFVAMTSHRPYRSAFKQSGALEELSNNTGVLYDENVVDAFTTIISNQDATT